MPVSIAMPDDIILLHRALIACIEQGEEELTIDIGNCGTAARFLTAYFAQRNGKNVILKGVERMHQRPIGQLVDALREIGAQIEYLGEEGFPPLRIKGCALDKHRIVRIENPLSTQFVSALLLIGANVHTNSTSPYIHITREIIQHYTILHNPTQSNVTGLPPLFGMNTSPSTVVRFIFLAFSAIPFKVTRLSPTSLPTSASKPNTPQKVL